MSKINMQTVIATGQPFKIDKIGLLVISIIVFIASILFAIFTSVWVGIIIFIFDWFFIGITVYMFRTTKDVIAYDSEIFTFVACPYKTKKLCKTEIANVYSHSINVVSLRKGRTMSVVVVVPRIGDDLVIGYLDDPNKACEQINKILNEKEPFIGREVLNKD